LRKAADAIARLRKWARILAQGFAAAGSAALI